ncbi:unnamed protein product [Triticum aestivum]|uniref:Uncharacterized protein n=1 Tax=Triticum aestivum TaxID=4565 RepID=A0A7H4LBC3_WHEAT|nr:unnamed protein product [Triticum aestivum]
MAMGVNLLDMSGNVVKMIRTSAAVTQCSLYGMCAHGELGSLVGRTDRRLRVLDVATGAVAAFPPRPRGAPACTLGRVPSTGEYKVLAIVPDTYVQVSMVLTLGSNGGGWWRDRGSPPVIVGRRHIDMAIVKGVAYFFVEMEDDLEPEDPHLIVGFDLETEKWLPVQLVAPPAREDHGHAPAHHHVDMSLAEVNGFLVAAHPDRDISAVKLWFMMNVHAEISLWLLLYKIPMAVGREYSFEKPLRVLDDGKIVVWSSLRGTRDGVPQIYDPRTNTLTQGAVTANCYTVGPYTGCLLRVGSSNPRRYKTLELLGAGSSHGHSRTIEYGRRRHTRTLPDLSTTSPADDNEADDDSLLYLEGVQLQEDVDGMAMGVNLLDTIGNVIKKITGHTAADQCSLHGMCANGELACLVGRMDQRLRVLDMATGAAAAFPTGHAGP